MRLQLHPKAEEELYSDAAWYDERELGLGDALVAEVLVTLDQVLDAPERWPLHPHVEHQLSPPIRRVVVDRFPYSLAYQAFTESVLVLAIAYAKRHPLYWSERTE